MTARLPPQNLDAERALLGGMLVGDAEMPECADIVEAGDFYWAQHAAIWREMVALAQRREPIDVATVGAALTRAQGPDSEDTVELVRDLDAAADVASGLAAHARIVRDCAVRRRLYLCARQAALDALEGDGLTPDLVARLQTDLLALSAEHSVKEPRTLASIVPVVLDRMTAEYERKSPIIGIPSGIAELDTMTTGFRPGELVVLAGRPSMGKSAALMRMAEACAESGGNVLVFSQEMPGDQLAGRAIAGTSRVAFNRVRSAANLLDIDWPKLDRGVPEIAGGWGRRIWIDDASGVTPAHIAAASRRLKIRAGSLALVCIDYLQIMDLGRGDNLDQQIGAATKALKALARTLEVPVVLLSQLNRGLEKREDKRPMMADLRSSGNIEQDADVVIFVFRESAYCATCQAGPGCTADHAGVAEILIRKQRNGPTGTVKVAFLSEFVRFENLAKGWG